MPASAFLPPLSLVVDTKTGVLYLTSDELFDMLRAMPPRLARVCARQWTAGEGLVVHIGAERGKHGLTKKYFRLVFPMLSKTQ